MFVLRILPAREPTSVQQRTHSRHNVDSLHLVVLLL